MHVHVNAFNKLQHTSEWKIVFVKYRINFDLLSIDNQNESTAFDLDFERSMFHLNTKMFVTT